MSLQDTVVAPILPGIAARGDGLDYCSSVWEGLHDILERTAQLQDGLSSIDEATGYMLDILGDWVNEPRGGLTDVDYRLIISGRRVAMSASATLPAIYRGWTEMMGSAKATISEDIAEVTLYAYKQTVDSAWLARAASVALDMIAAGREVYAVVEEDGDFLWNITAFDTHGFSHDFGS